MTHIWTARHSNSPGEPKRCRAAVTPKDDRFGWLHQHQCTRKPLVFRCVDGADYGFCKQHDPEAVKAMDAARRASWSAEWKANEEKERLRKQTLLAMDACKAAVEQIAAGHNDPRSLAAEVLSLFPASALTSKDAGGGK